MSNVRTFKVYIQDILDASQSILEYTKNYTLEKFSGDKKTIDAVIRNFEIIGEAAKKIPQQVKDKYPDLHWRGRLECEINSFMNILESTLRLSGILL